MSYSTFNPPYPYLYNSTFFPGIQQLTDRNSIILWHNSSDHATQMWYMNANRLVRRATVVDENGNPIFVGPPWSIVGISDMNSDGQPDIIWYDSNLGAIQIWFMNGNRITRRANVVAENGSTIFVGPPWGIVATANNRIIWYDSNLGVTQIWHMNGNQITRRGNVLDENGNLAIVAPSSNWTAVAASSSAIVWHDSATNATQLWYIDNNDRIYRRANVVYSDGTLAAIGPPWSIVGYALMNFIGRSTDIIWYNSSTGETQIWFMIGYGYMLDSRATVVWEDGTPAYVGPPWHIVGVNTSFIPMEPGAPR